MVKERQNILFLANRVPFPPDKGDRIRTFHQLDYLAASHNVYCACFVETGGEMSRARMLRRWCADVAAVRWDRNRAAFRAMLGWLSGKPLTLGAYQHRQMRQRLARWGKEIDFDAVVAFSASMAPYAMAFPAKRRVLDLCDADSEKWSEYSRYRSLPWSLVCRAEGRRLRRFEEACLDGFDATTVITDRERDVLDPGRRRDCLHVVPNGAVLPAEPLRPASMCGPVVGFVGAMDYWPNVEGICWFVRKVWPRIVGCIREARLLVVGRNPARRVRQLAAVPGVEITGQVDNVGRYLSRCRVVVAPLRVARGLQNKVLEAMAARRPVVATSAVSSCLRAISEHHLFVADDPAEFASKVVALCDFDGLCDKIGEAGYRCVASYYSWAEALQRFEQIVLGASAAEAPSSMTPRCDAANACGAQPEAVISVP